MKALGLTGFPVPTMHLLCEDTSIIGTAFYVMDFVEGRIYENPGLEDARLTPADRTAIYRSMIDTMAALHAAAPATIGLDDFGRHGGYIERQISRWSKQFEASRTDDMPAMDALIAWLPDHIPGPDETTVVHGDFRMGNLILHPTEPKVIAVLDWELATLGHPLSDLAYNCLGYHFPRENKQFNGMIGLDFAGLGIPDEDEVVAMYCAATGREAFPIGISTWPSTCSASRRFARASISAVWTATPVPRTPAIMVSKRNRRPRSDGTWPKGFRRAASRLADLPSDPADPARGRHPATKNSH